MAKNQAEIDAAKDFNWNSKKNPKQTTNQPNKTQKKTGIKHFYHQESEEVGLSHGEGRMEINTATLSSKWYKYFAFFLRRTNRVCREEQSKVTSGNGSRRCHLSDESQLKVAQHAYFQEMLATVVSEISEEITQTLNIPPQGKGKAKRNYLTLQGTGRDGSIQQWAGLKGELGCF